MAVPGVVATIALTAALLVSASGLLGVAGEFTWQSALVFGALIAATDPVAVVALFKSLGVPTRLVTLIEGESLLNDGTAIVFFTLVLDVVLGHAVSLRPLLNEFLAIVGLGALVGVAIGLGVSTAIRRLDDPMIEITLTTIAAYGSFLVADQLHASGVIATVVAGVICRHHGARTGMSASTRVAVATFWEYIAFALNSLVFLLIGFEVALPALVAAWPTIGVAYGAVTLGRGLVIVAVSVLLRLTRDRLPSGWSLVLTWGGLRGGLSMVLVLGLPAAFAHRDLLVATTFGVVIVSILGQGLTMPPLLRRLGIGRASAQWSAYERARGELQAVSAALTELDAMARTHVTAPEVLEELRMVYTRRAQQAEATLYELDLEHADLRRQARSEAQRRLLLVEKAQLLDAVRLGHISQAVHDQLISDVDVRLSQLDTAGHPEEPAETVAKRGEMSRTDTASKSPAP